MTVNRPFYERRCVPSQDNIRVLALTAMVKAAGERGRLSLFMRRNDQVKKLGNALVRTRPSLPDLSSAIPHEWIQDDFRGMQPTPPHLSSFRDNRCPRQALFSLWNLALPTTAILVSRTFSIVEGICRTKALQLQPLFFDEPDAKVGILVWKVWRRRLLER